ncbi:cystathionine gamma-lyase [Rhodobacteraceae bacterium 63075]|nr:cystathionine gamma-lyase [Rhodobacteraceae bacterium 63075]
MQDQSKRLMAMLHMRTDALTAGEAIPEPITLTSAFELPAQPDPSRVYARLANPTVEAVEARIAALEAAPTRLFPSGLGAYTAVAMAALKAGDKVLMLSDGYYAARNLMADVFARFDVSLATCAATELETCPLDDFALVIIETPSNPGLDIIDIAALAERCRVAGARLAVDNTVCTPLLQNPLDLGADISICSDTKAMGGHSDLLMGHVSSRDEAFIDAVQSVRNLSGNIPAPFECWLLLRGLETLELRLARMCENARAALPLLEGSPAVTQVVYPQAHAQASDRGFLIGATFKDAETADRFLKKAGFAAMTSFGGLHSSGDRRARWGDDVAGGFLRLSFGVEPTDALTAQIEAALAEL